MDERDQATRILLARLHGTVHYHVRLNPAQDAPRDVALAAVAEFVDGRPDRRLLLAEIAGITSGPHSGPRTPIRPNDQPTS